MTAPKKFGENPTEATELLKNGTEKIGLDQNGVAKKIAAETLMTKANVGLGLADNTSDADKPVSDAQGLINGEIKGVGWTDETVKGNADAIQSHKLAIMPHQFQDLLTGKTYKYGFQLSAEGNPQTIYEEVV